MAGVDEPSVIDVVTQKPTGGFELIMVETRPWADPPAAIERQGVQFVLDVLPPRG